MTLIVFDRVSYIRYIFGYYWPKNEINIYLYSRIATINMRDNSLYS